MLNLNVKPKLKYLANMQIYTACHRKYQNKSFPSVVVDAVAVAVTVAVIADTLLKLCIATLPMFLTKSLHLTNQLLSAVEFRSRMIKSSHVSCLLVYYSYYRELTGKRTELSISNCTR